MNRSEEYQELLKELETAPTELDGTLERAMKRRRRQVAIYRPLIGMAAVFAIFVLLVNSSETIAHACARIPVLREVAEAVTFSKSLSKAVENEYVQEINLVQRDGDVSVEIPYLIVDQKSVHIFYKLYSNKYEVMNAEKQVYSADGKEALEYTGLDRYYNMQSGELNHFRMEFEEEIPAEMFLVLDILSEEKIVAQVEFLLEFDPTFTSLGKKLELNKSFEIDGQHLRIRDIEIYPTHMRMNIVEEEGNSAWLKGMEFYILSGEEKFSSGVAGLVSTGSMEYDNMICYRAESIYFYNAEDLKLVITGAKWLDKNQESAYVNLKTGEHKGFPDNIKFVSREGKELWVEVEQPIDRGLQIVFDSYHDAQGNRTYFGACGGPGLPERIEGNREFVLQYGILENYSEDEVWIDFVFTRDVDFEEPITVQIK